MPIEIILTHFDAHIGAKILLAYPNPAESDEEGSITKIFDLNLETSYFEIILEEKHYLNYQFSLSSSISRGGIENGLISVILSEEQVIHNWKSELETVVEKTLAIPKIVEIFQQAYLDHPNLTSIQAKLSQIEALFKSLLDNYHEKEKYHPNGQLLITGIEKVGKTSILARLRNEEFSDKMRPTLGTAILRAAIQKFKFLVHDVGGQKKLRKDWFNSCAHPDGIVYVVDISAPEADIPECMAELNRVVTHYYSEVLCDFSTKIPLLILLNKTDLIERSRIPEKKRYFTRHLSIDTGNNPMGIFPVSAKENTGIDVAFKWFITEKLKS